MEKPSRPPRVFPDTGVLLAMIVFPRDQTGAVSLAGEVLQLHEEGAIELIIGRAVVDELEEVLDERFPTYRAQAVSLLRPYAEHLTRWPTPGEITAVLSACADPFDAPIFASAIIARPDIVLSNDFEAFHTRQAKSLWREHDIVIEGLYGLLCVFDLRERKGDQAAQDP